MNRLHLSLDFNASNPVQMRALSNFTAELADNAPEDCGLMESREIPHGYAAELKATQERLAVTEAKLKVATATIGMTVEVLETQAAATAEQDETAGEKAPPAEEDAPKTTRTRRSKEQIALDKEIKAEGLPPRMKLESVEDYHARTSDEVSPKADAAAEHPADEKATAEAASTDTTDAEVANGPGPGPAPQDGAETNTAADEPDPAVESAKANLRKVLSTKIKAHKDEVIKEFKKYGAQNVSTLPAEHYPAFIAFLKGLS